MSRHSWRGIFIIIIFLSIPCYLVGFWFLASSPQNTQATAFPSATAIIATDIPVSTSQPTLENTPTTFAIVTLEQPIPVFPTAIPIITATSISTIAPTNTSIPTTVSNTAVPTATQPILLPPTDTPSP